MGFFRRQFFQPPFEIPVQAALIVVDKYACRDMHRVYQTKPLTNAALRQCGLDLRGDVNISTAGFSMEKKLLAIAFHWITSFYITPFLLYTKANFLGTQ